MARVDETLELVRSAAADMGAAPLARAANVSDDFIRRLLLGEVSVVQKLARLEVAAQAHADQQREKWSADAGGAHV